MTKPASKPASKQFGAAAALRAALLVTGSTYVAYAAGLLTSTLIARALGPADYGRYAYLVWLSGILVVLMNNGLTTSSIRFISESIGRRDETSAKALHHWFWVRQWWSVLVIGALFTVALPWVKPVGWESSLVVVAAIVIAASVPKAWYLFGVSMAKGYGRFGIEATSLTTMSLVTAASVIALMVMDADLFAFLVLFVVSSLAHPALLSRMRQSPVRDVAARTVAPDILARLKSHYHWTAVLMLVGVFYGTAVSMFFLNHYATAAAVGFFSVAVALTRGGVELLSSGLNSVLMPLMAHGFGEGGRDRTAQITADATRMFHCFGLLLTGVGLLWAGPLLQVMYGSRFADAAFPFQVLITVGGLTLPLGVIGTLMSTTDQQGLRFGLTAAAVSLSALTAWWLVPTHGLNGALASYAATTFFMYACTIATAVRLSGMQMPWQAMLRLTLAALCAGALASSLLWLTNQLWAQFAAGVVFIVAYPAATLLLRAWRASDLALVASQAQRLGRLGGLVRGLERWGA
jgi:O-antigen/teichoic acid export membrane protein